MTEVPQRTTARSIRTVEPRVLAVLGGTVTGLTGAVAYFLAPLATSEYVNAGGGYAFGITGSVLEFFFAQSLLYHFGVLVLVPFLTTAVALSLARRAGHVGRWTDVTIATGVVAGPVVMIWLGAFVALLAIAFQSPGVAVYGFFIAVPVALVLSVCVAVVTTVSAVSGYALVERFGPRHSE